MILAKNKFISFEFYTGKIDTLIAHSYFTIRITQNTAFQKAGKAEPPSEENCNWETTQTISFFFQLQI